jgi:Biopolymer transport proteins
MNVYEDTYLLDIMHGIAQGLLGPTMAILILLIAVSIFLVGQVIVEYFTERRHFKQNMPLIINKINDSDFYSITNVVVYSRLLKYQKAALVTVSQNMGLPEESLFALAQVKVNDTEKGYGRRLAWVDTIAKIAPLLGLMGTLIPLGPGIVALGEGDTLALSQSMIVAFDATVCGLVCAIIALILSKIRSGWYNEYINVLESIMSCVLDKAATARKSGIALPAGYTGDPTKEFQDVKSNKERKR